MKRVQLGKKVKYNIRALSSYKPLQQEWKEIWSEIKADVDAILRTGSLSIDSYAQTFHQVIELSADPRIAFRFDALNDRLWVNIWNAMFHPPFEIAGALVHETDHQDFQRKKGKIGVPWPEYQAFRKLCEKELELSAFTKELNFLRKVQDSIEPKWEARLNGTIIHYEMTKHITERERWIAALSSMGADASLYQPSSTDESKRDIILIMKKLNINLSGMNAKIVGEPILWETAF